MFSSVNRTLQISFNFSLLSLSLLQGQLAKAYVAFLLRQKGSKTYRLHLLRASNDKSGTAVLKAFKSAFDQCMLATLPSALCSTCPLLVLNNLCRDLNSKQEIIAVSMCTNYLQT